MVLLRLQPKTSLSLDLVSGIHSRLCLPSIILSAFELWLRSSSTQPTLPGSGTKFRDFRLSHTFIWLVAVFNSFPTFIHD
jgi:hypothetical protein